MYSYLKEKKSLKQTLIEFKTKKLKEEFEYVDNKIRRRIKINKIICHVYRELESKTRMYLQDSGFVVNRHGLLPGYVISW